MHNTTQDGDSGDDQVNDAATEAMAVSDAVQLMKSPWRKPTRCQRTPWLRCCDSWRKVGRDGNTEASYIFGFGGLERRYQAAV